MEIFGGVSGAKGLVRRDALDRDEQAADRVSKYDFGDAIRLEKIRSIIGWNGQWR